MLFPYATILLLIVKKQIRHLEKHDFVFEKTEPQK